MSGWQKAREQCFEISELVRAIPLLELRSPAGKKREQGLGSSNVAGEQHAPTTHFQLRFLLMPPPPLRHRSAEITLSASGDIRGRSHPQKGPLLPAHAAASVLNMSTASGGSVSASE